MSGNHSSCSNHGLDKDGERRERTIATTRAAEDIMRARANWLVMIGGRR